MAERFSTEMIPRRLVLHSLGFVPILFNIPLIAEDVSSAIALNNMQFLLQLEAFRSQKLDSGVRIQEAREGDLVEVNYVCRRSNGYFVHSTVDQFSGESSPVILPLNEKEIIKGLKEVIIGMKAGGKRRALIPSSVGYVNENLGPIPDEVCSTFCSLRTLNSLLVVLAWAVLGRRSISSRAGPNPLRGTTPRSYRSSSTISDSDQSKRGNDYSFFSTRAMVNGQRINFLGGIKD